MRAFASEELEIGTHSFNALLHEKLLDGAFPVNVLLDGASPRKELYQSPGNIEQI